MLRSFTRVTAAAAITAALVAALATVPLHAQDATPVDRDTTAACLGFAFGSWSPPLDWHAARHQGAPDSTSLGHAPSGRGWASDQGMSDSTLMLYPGWWPVGVSVALPRRTPAIGDTVTGLATALVADGRVRNPIAKVRAWRVACGQANRSGAALSPVADSTPHRGHVARKPTH